MFCIRCSGRRGVGGCTAVASQDLAGTELACCFLCNGSACQRYVWLGLSMQAAKMTELEALCLTRCRKLMNGAMEAVATLPNLTSFKVSECDLITDEGMLLDQQRDSL